MIDERGLVGLLHRADWTRLSLSAETSHGTIVLIAPGRRYLYQEADYAIGCDGGRPWLLSHDEDNPDESVHWSDDGAPPLARLLCPAWLLDSSSVLRIVGEQRFCGRDALEVATTSRRRPPDEPDAAGVDDGQPEPVRVLVDVETGVLLRIADPDYGEGPEVTEMTRADFAPVIDEGRFAPPPGSRMSESFGESLSSELGPVWWAAKTAAGLAAGALGAWMRYSPLRRSSAPADGIEMEAAIPRDEPAPARSPDGVPAGPQLSDDLLAFLYRGGTDRFAATLHEWIGLGALASSVPAAARGAGFGGLGLLMDVISEQPATAGHQTSRIRIASHDQYQIDHGHRASARKPVTIACDGQTRWRVYRDKITAGEPEPLPRDIGDLCHPAWLLRCRLSGGTQVTIGDRPAYRINAARRPGEEDIALMFPAAVAVVDAEFGLILRLTCYIGERPVTRQEIRDLTTGIADFAVQLPDDLPTVREQRPFTPGSQNLTDNGWSGL